MGIEYNIGCRNMTPDALDNLLRQAPFFARREPKYGGYEYRAPGNEDTTRMPDVHINMAGDGIIFVESGHRDVAKAVLAFIEHSWGEAGECFALEEL